MSGCNTVSAIQLSAIAFAFLLAVLWLDAVWVRMRSEPHHDDIGLLLKRQSLLNAFVAFGAVMAAVVLTLWVASCNRGL
jgi:hypothetical protein